MTICELGFSEYPLTLATAISEIAELITFANACTIIEEQVVQFIRMYKVYYRFVFDMERDPQFKDLIRDVIKKCHEHLRALSNPEYIASISKEKYIELESMVQFILAHHAYDPAILK